MYSDTVNGLVDKHPLELPEPVGPIVHLQEKLFVPVKEYPDVSVELKHITLWQIYHNASDFGAFYSELFSDKSCLQAKYQKEMMSRK